MMEEAEICQHGIRDMLQDDGETVGVDIRDQSQVESSDHDDHDDGQVVPF